jgi:transcriptional regulator with XRE-family HTH domain
MSQEDYSNLPTWIPEQLKRVGLTKEQLAHRAGISRTSVYRYIYDTDRPNSATMMRICCVLKIPAEEGFRQYTPKKNGRPLRAEKLHLRNRVGYSPL